MAQRIVESNNFYYNLDKQIIISKNTDYNFFLNVKSFINDPETYNFSESINVLELHNLIFWEENKSCMK